MTRRSVVAAVSVCVHAIVLLVLMTADLWTPISTWPMPRSAMAFVDDIRPVHVDSPSPVRALDVPGSPTRSMSEAAPIAPPPDIAPETIVFPRFSNESERDVIGPIAPLSGIPGTPATPPPAPFAPPAPQAPIRLHSGIRPPQRLVNVTPAYPAIARSAHVEGVVIIEATIDELGNVVRTQLLRSIPLLDEAALAAVRQWKFSPTQLNGVAVPIVMTVTVNFTLK